MDSLKTEAKKIRNPERPQNPSLYNSLVAQAALHPDTFKNLKISDYMQQLSQPEFDKIQEKWYGLNHHDDVSAEADVKRKARMDETTAKKNATLIQHRANLLNSIKDPEMRKNIEKHLPALDTLPHGVTPSHAPTVPGAPMPTLPPVGGSSMFTPVKPVKDSISALKIPQSWKDASTGDADYAAYLDHYSEVAS